MMMPNHLVSGGYLLCDSSPQTSPPIMSGKLTERLAAKGAYIKSTGLRGFAMWEAGGDYHDILLDSIRKGVGF